MAGEREKILRARGTDGEHTGTASVPWHVRCPATTRVACYVARRTLRTPSVTQLNLPRGHCVMAGDIASPLPCKPLPHLARPETVFSHLLLDSLPNLSLGASRRPGSILVPPAFWFPRPIPAPVLFSSRRYLSRDTYLAPVSLARCGLGPLRCRPRPLSVLTVLRLVPG